MRYAEYIKLHKRLFYIKEKEGVLKEFGDYKLLNVIEFLQNNSGLNSYCNFTLEYLITECGYIPKTGKSKSVENFKNILLYLQQQNAIETELDLKTIKLKQLITVKNIMQLEKDYVVLTQIERDKIYNVENVDNLKLLIHYLYIKSRVHIREGADKMPISASGGKQQVCYPSLLEIEKDLGISQNKITEYNQILVDIELIKIANAGLYYLKNDPHKTKRESRNTYTLTSIKWHDEELENAIEEYKKNNTNKVFLNTREYKNNNKKINGYIARIEYLQKEGKATKEQINQMELYKEEIENRKDDNVTMYDIASLIDTEQDILSSIYMNKTNEKLSDKYFDIEEYLNLLNEEQNLREEIDLDYYRWIMTNYTEYKKEYFKNCVQAKINKVLAEELQGVDDNDTNRKDDTLKQGITEKEKHDLFGLQSITKNDKEKEEVHNWDNFVNDLAKRKAEEIF